ncbi:MAG: hypothetical protein ACRDJO_01135 [Actinomycetota bacterium]
MSMERAGGRAVARGAVAGAVAAGVWAAVEPALGRVLRTSYTDVRFLGRMGGRFLPAGRAWPAAGLAWHVANGAAFGAAFAGLGGRGAAQGFAAAQAENALTYPLLPLVARRHPDYRGVAWAGPEGRRILVQETLLHGLYGVVLGTLSGPPPAPAAPRAPALAAAARLPFEFAPRYRRILRLLGITEETAWVDLSSGVLRARFGPWGVETHRNNIRSVSVAGPYRPRRVIGPHLSLSDRGATFGTTPDRGVCVEFHVPVRGQGPLRLVRVPNLTVTVRDPDALVSALDGGGRPLSPQ